MWISQQLCGNVLNLASSYAVTCSKVLGAIFLFSSIITYTLDSSRLARWNLLEVAHVDPLLKITPSYSRSAKHHLHFVAVSRAFLSWCFIKVLQEKIVNVLWMFNFRLTQKEVRKHKPSIIQKNIGRNTNGGFITTFHIFISRSSIYMSA